MLKRVRALLILGSAAALMAAGSAASMPSHIYITHYYSDALRLDEVGIKTVACSGTATRNGVTDTPYFWVERGESCQLIEPYPL